MSALKTGFSLADFANTVTDDIKALDSLLPPAGTFACRINSAMLGENETKDGIDPQTNEPYLPLFFAEFKCEVLEAQPLDKDIDPSTLIGRVINDRFTFWPSAFNDMIGLLKGRYKKVGFDINGRVGGMEGGEPGWLDGANEKIIGLKIVHRTRKDDTRAYFSWFKLEEGEDSAEELPAETEAA